MTRNFECPETNVLCIERRCKKGKICSEQDKQLAAESLSRVAENDLTIRRRVSQQEFKHLEWSKKLQERPRTWSMGKKKPQPPKISN
jgi:hypothetical protein